MTRKIIITLLVLLVAIQFFHPAKNTAATPSGNSICDMYATPDEVKHLLQVSCNDCHSNNTIYPWYYNIQPVAWWMANHVNEGKRELNFDEFKNSSPRRQYRKLEKLVEEIREGDMPLDSYTWIHKNAVLNEAQKKQITGWAESIRRQMEQQYPKDSLVKKQ